MGQGTLESGSLITPAEYASAITPHDTNDLPAPLRGVYVGATGDLHVLMVGGSDVTFVDLAEGIVHPIRIIRVFSTGTTATSIVGLR